MHLSVLKEEQETGQNGVLQAVAAAAHPTFFTLCHASLLVMGLKLGPLGGLLCVVRTAYSAVDVCGLEEDRSTRASVGFASGVASWRVPLRRALPSSTHFRRSWRGRAACSSGITELEFCPLG